MQPDIQKLLHNDRNPMLSSQSTNDFGTRESISTPLPEEESTSNFFFMENGREVAANTVPFEIANTPGNDYSNETVLVNFLPEEDETNAVDSRTGHTQQTDQDFDRLYNNHTGLADPLPNNDLNSNDNNLDFRIPDINKLVKYSPNNDYYHIVGSSFDSKFVIHTHFPSVFGEANKIFYVNFKLKRTSLDYCHRPINKVCDLHSQFGSNPIMPCTDWDQNAEVSKTGDGGLNIIVDDASLTSAGIQKTFALSFPCTDNCVRNAALEKEKNRKEAARDSCLEYTLMVRDLQTGEHRPISGPFTVKTWIKASIAKRDLDAKSRRKTKGSKRQIENLEKKIADEIQSRKRIADEALAFAAAAKIKKEEDPEDELVNLLKNVIHKIPEHEKEQLTVFLQQYTN